jgi:hypothetical protein
MHHTLTSMFAGMFRRQGFTVVTYDALECCEFENFCMKGMIMFDKEKKCHRVRWKMKEGYYLYDVPFAPGYTSSQFSKAGDMMNFLARRLVWKKQR